MALTVAGSDSSGGAGIAADLKTFQAHGVWGAVALTAVTAQSSLGVLAQEPVSTDLVAAQIAAVAGDMGVDAAKTGMLAGAEIVSAVAAAVRDIGIAGLVVDPVMRSSRGEPLLSDDGVEVMRRDLLPLAAVVTPNLAEAAVLAGGGTTVDDRADMEAVARRICQFGPGAVLVTGGHLAGEGPADCLVVAGAEAVWLEGSRVDSPHTHGSGCVLSAAICAQLALGADVVEACRSAKAFTAAAIAGGFALGAGAGPVDPGAPRGPVSGRAW